MEIIKINDVKNLKGGNVLQHYTISINNSMLTIETWDLGYQKLTQFLLDCEEAIIEMNQQKMKKIHEKYNLNSPHLILSIYQVGFYESFLELYNHYGKNALKMGEFITRASFCKSIGINKYNPTVFSNLFQEAESNFYDSIVNPHLMKAFDEKSTVDVKNIYKAIRRSRFFLISNNLSSQFESYLLHCAEKLFQKNGKISYSSFCKFALLSTGLDKDSMVNNEILFKVFKVWERNALQLENNRVQMKLGSNKWIIPYRDIQFYRTKSFDFSMIQPSFKREIQKYLLSYYKKGESAKGVFRRFSNLKRIFLCLQETPEYDASLLNITYVEVLRLFDALKQFKKSDKKKYRLKTIQASISEARMLFDWLKVETNNNSLKNPFRRLKLNNLSGFVKNAEYVPEIIVNKLSSVIHECPIYVQRVWIIMMNTGMRVSEVLNLLENCLEFNDKENIYYLNFVQTKTFNRRRKNGHEDLHSIPLMQETLEIIKMQIEDSKELRQLGQTNKIFIKQVRSSYTDLNKIQSYTISNINEVINSCITRHQIRDENGEIWHYTNQQCRKTLAVKLLSKGSSIADVGEILGHMEEKTTRVYYQDVDSIKIAEMDQQLFAQLFDSLEESVRGAYLPVEIEQLKKEILSGVRETPEGHGSCAKHVSFGPCKKRSCVGCSLLITGPQKLPMWEKLYLEQKNYIDNIVKDMSMKNILDYENYRDYQSEVHLLNLYKDTIEKLEKFIETRKL